MERRPGRNISYWLGLVLGEAREAARPKVSRNKAARLIGVDASTLWRFEKQPEREEGDLRETDLPRHIDRYLAAYAQLLGVEDGREFLEQALDQWMKDGAPPVLSEVLQAETEIERLDRNRRELEIRERARDARRARRQSG